MGQLIRIFKDEQGKLYSDVVYNMGQISNCPKVKTNLVYDSETKVVYYMFTEYGGEAGGLHMRSIKIGYLSPYISQNGKYCRYNVELAQIEEIA